MSFVAGLGSVVLLSTPSMASPMPADESGPILPRFIQSINDCGSNEAKVRQDFADAAAMANLAFDNLDAGSNA